MAVVARANRLAGNITVTFLSSSMPYCSTSILYWYTGGADAARQGSLHTCNHGNGGSQTVRRACSPRTAWPQPRRGAGGCRDELDPSLYQWTPVPRSRIEAISYIETALEWEDAGKAVSFAIVRTDDGVVMGSTRFWNLERGYGPGIIRGTAFPASTPARSATRGSPPPQSERQPTPSRSCSC